MYVHFGYILPNSAPKSESRDITRGQNPPSTPGTSSDFLPRRSKPDSGIGVGKYMSEQEMLERSEKFAPYRSIFMWYMWRVEEVDTNVVEGP